jgi:hypothetical protein
MFKRIITFYLEKVGVSFLLFFIIFIMLAFQNYYTTNQILLMFTLSLYNTFEKNMRYLKFSFFAILLIEVMRLLNKK